jgi:hypothetical protein
MYAEKSVGLCLAVPERSLDMMQTKPNLDSVQITCVATGVYPEPKMALLRGSKKK